MKGMQEVSQTISFITFIPVVLFGSSPVIAFILNNDDISTDLHAGTTVLDFVRYHKNLKGTKIGCREGDCGACTILVGELIEGQVRYRSMTSCLMPLANAVGKHIVTVEGVNPSDGSLTPVQRAMIDESGTQCGFCTVGFVMSLTGFCIDGTEKSEQMAVSSIDGNICRCTGYKSIERAAVSICDMVNERRGDAVNFVPAYFPGIAARLVAITLPNPKSKIQTRKSIVAGGTDVYVQKPDDLVETDSIHVFFDETLRGIVDHGSFIEIGASATVTDLLESPVIQAIFPDLYRHLKLVSSTPIRNMATLAGNFVNASPIGDMTVWFLALDADIVFNNGRDMPLRKLYLGYKKLAKTDQEFIRTIRFRKPGNDFHFNFEKVCKRTYLDIASVNTAISLTVESLPGAGWIPPVLSEPGAVATGTRVDYVIIDAHVSAGGVAPVPLYLKETSDFLRDQPVTAAMIADANEIMQAEISPISDVRGSADYKRLLLRQLFRAHFVELFEI
jgi:xanthine dehydrogenase small subunit